MHDNTYEKIRANPKYRQLVSTRDTYGWIMTILLGVIGAVVGGMAASTFGFSERWLQWAVAIVAAIILLFVYEAMRKKRPVTR